MRTAFLLGRQCLRQWPRQLPHSARAPVASRPLSILRRQFTPAPLRGKTVLFSGAAGAATLSSLAFVALSEGEASNGDKTHEEVMLEASRQELREHVPCAIQNSKVVRRSIYFFVDLYIVEPICTALRFLHLVVIFVPIIVTVPAIWFGKRQPDRDNERSGTLWWYGFLVSSMERAGAAFIKVRRHWRPQIDTNIDKRFLAGSMGSISLRYLPHGTLHYYVYTPLERPCALPP
jgi:aarF domain-containing kinase